MGQNEVACRIGFIHDEFGYARKLERAYPYTHPSAFYAETGLIHGTIHYIPKALHCDKLPFRADFDYSPYDLIIFFLQGGRDAIDVKIMHALRKSAPDALLIWWWGEIYRFNQSPELWWEHVLVQENHIARIMDVMASPFHVYEDIMSPIYTQRFNKPYRTLFEPYDTKHILAHHSKTYIDIDGGVWTMIHGRASDISRTLKVMGKVQQKYDIKCLINLHHNQKYDEIMATKPSNLKFEVVPIYQPHDAFLDHLKQYYIVIDDYPAICSSNLTCNTASVGVPTISHTFNTSASLCFPSFTFGLDDLDAWVQGIESLIKDETLYKATVHEAQDAAHRYYSFEAVRRQVERIYKEFKK